MSNVITLPSMFPDLDEHVASRTSSRIYFGLGQNGQLKIGLTRRRDGRRGGEMHFAELCSVPGGRDVEDWYHAKYAAERIGRTEWFALSNRLLLDVVVMCVAQKRTASVETLKSLILGRLGQVAA